MSYVEEKDSKTNGRWTKEEHQKFLLGVQLFGKNWKKIEELVGTRSGSQIRSHAQKFFLKDTKPKQVCQTFEESHESQVQQSPVTVIPKTYKLENNDHSYFLNKIIQGIRLDAHVSFWDLFMDVKCQKLEAQQEVKVKDCFIHDSCNDSKMETAFPYLSLITDGI